MPLQRTKISKINNTKQLNFNYRVTGTLICNDVIVNKLWPLKIHFSVSVHLRSSKSNNFIRVLVIKIHIY